jgi:excinuclease UvrABC nuclease subunit
VSAQLRLFPLPRPLVERLGQEFFKSAPREPGVYIMRGAQERILYIGQSKNLRTRLAFYKNANPDRIPRRLTRLVHQVESITLERCPTAIAARARELELLREHRPRFNRADTGPQYFHYLDWKTERANIAIQLHFDPPSHPDQQWHGPVRGRVIPRQALAALQRLTICHERQIRHCADLPILPSRIHAVQLPFTHGIEDFLRGKSVDLVTSLLEAQPPDTESALRQLHECDAEILLSWFRLLQDL